MNWKIDTYPISERWSGMGRKCKSLGLPGFEGSYVTTTE